MGKLIRNGVEYSSSGSKATNISFSNSTMSAKNVQDAVDELNNNLDATKIIKGTEKTVTTGTTGNVAVGISNNYRIASVSVSNAYMGLPFVSGSAWYIKVINPSNMSSVNSTSVSYRVDYYKA